MEPDGPINFTDLAYNYYFKFKNGVVDPIVYISSSYIKKPFKLDLQKMTITSEAIPYLLYDFKKRKLININKEFPWKIHKNIVEHGLRLMGMELIQVKFFYKKTIFGLAFIQKRYRERGFHHKLLNNPFTDIKIDFSF